VQLRRFKHICYINIYKKLKELIREKAKFRGLQKKSIYAIITRQSLIVNIIATREGKSMLFMLLTYCVYKGSTIVIILLCLLQEDLERQCKESCIKCV
jgi:superfamily II DNA helicase RecQ